MATFSNTFLSLDQIHQGVHEGNGSLTQINTNVHRLLLRLYDLGAPSEREEGNRSIKKQDLDAWNSACSLEVLLRDMKLAPHSPSPSS